MDRPIIARGEKVLLVPPVEEDVGWLWKEVNDRDTFLPIGQYGFVSLEDEKSFVRKCYDRDGPTLLILDEKEERVGIIGINKYNRYHGIAEIGYWIAKGKRGKGYATDALRTFTRYAFRELNYRRLYAFTTEDNIASQRVLQEVGYRLEGRLRKHRYRPHLGKYVDALIYGLLRDEWREIG